MFRNIGTKIYLIRGDSAHIPYELPIVDDKKKVIGYYEFEEGDEVACMVRDFEADDNDLLFVGSVEINEDKKSITWHIKPEDTAEAEPKIYHYDIEVRKSNGDIETLVPYSEIEILQDVTYFQNAIV